MLRENIEDTLLCFCLLVPHGITGIAKTQGRLTGIYGKVLTVVHYSSLPKYTYRQAIQHAGPTFTFFPSTCKFSTYPPKRFETNPRFPTSFFFTLKISFFFARRRKDLIELPSFVFNDVYISRWGDRKNHFLNRIYYPLAAALTVSHGQPLVSMVMQGHCKLLVV